MKAGVTTGRNSLSFLRDEAKRWAEKLNMPFLDRYAPLDVMQREKELDALLVVTKQGPKVVLPDGNVFFFHPSLSVLRVQRLEQGGQDTLLNALALKAGESVLDCTLGLATDACVIAYAVGATGQVHGLEASPLIALVVREGLKDCRSHSEAPDWFKEASLRISVKNANYEDVLATLPDNAYDVVYFDPMFAHPVQSSANMQPLRPLAKDGGVSASSLLQARRVAKKRVVIKDHCSAALLKDLHAPTLGGGKYSRVRFGVWEAES